jgi:hypothetical protein
MRMPGFTAESSIYRGAQVFFPSIDYEPVSGFENSVTPQIGLGQTLAQACYSWCMLGCTNGATSGFGFAPGPTGYYAFCGPLCRIGCGITQMPWRPVVPPPPPPPPPPPLLGGAWGALAAGASALIIGGLVVANVKYHFTMGDETGCSGVPGGTCPDGSKGYPCATPGGLCYYNGFWGSTVGKCTTVPTAASGEKAFGGCKCECM